MPDKAGWLIESATSNVVKIIMQERGLPMAEAMRDLFASDLFAALSDRETGLYLESPSHLYELFKLYG